MALLKGGRIDWRPSGAAGWGKTLGRCEASGWEAEQERELQEFAREHDEFMRFEREREEELQRIKDSRPLGVPPPIEPRSIHSCPATALEKKVAPIRSWLEM
jgi:hypothetical protein